MINIPEMKVGIVAVSRDCFPESLSVNRRKALVDAYAAKYDSKDIYECPVCIVESEIHMVQALEDIKKAGCNALCVYLGNFGPEISETLLAKHFDGPKMFVAASEENITTLSSNRGDAYCGMLNASYNLKLRNIKAYIPEYPVGNAEECADMIHEFLPIARAVYALNNLKIISFGPRPLNFLACNAPIKPLYDLGVEIEENSELDLFESFNKHAGDERIPEVVKDMEAELGAGNKKPEVLAKHFDGPKMFVAASEENIATLSSNRGDAYCGMLNASYNLKLRNIKAYIPEYPVGNAEECADMIHEFLPIARAVYALNNLKIISFGPRPLNFLACNAPIKPLYDLGVEIEENSELDLFESFNKHAGDERIPEIVKDMEAELGAGNKKPEVLAKLAQYELTLLDWVEAHKGYRKYVAIAGKCWPAFQTQFGFVPCYVNSRLTGRGIPVSCEVDIYGALSEFIGTVVSEDATTLLDINNTVPAELYNKDIKDKFNYTLNDTFMGFHCGNTSSKKLSFCEMKYQLIMARSLPIEVTNGTLEGDIVPGDITFYRLQSTADTKLRAYIAQGEVLPVATHSFGSIGVFAIPEMGRFYRHVLIEKNFPHHGAVAFGHYGKALYEVFKYLGVPVEDINFNQPKGMLYPTENPFC